MRRFFIPITMSFLALAWLTSCQTLHFYGQAAWGQFEILRKSRPNEEAMADPATPEAVRSRLAKVERIRSFASEHLALPGDESYGKYADLGREHVVWVVYAAPEFSVEPKTWFYPAIGEMDYRGYFNETDAEAQAAELHKEGYDVFVGGVDAYSTLGWFHDPVLNTFIDYPEVFIAETIFHELTHRVIFRRGDTEFNESLANVVAEEGVKRWLRHEGRLAELRGYEILIDRRREFYREIDRSRWKLGALYASGRPEGEMRQKKAEIMSGLRDQVRALQRRWGVVGLEDWLKDGINNAHIISLKIYADKMPAFERLLAECGGDLRLFYKRAERLELP